MKHAKSLLLEVLAAIPAGEKVAPLFAEDGVVELPFLHSVGIEPRYKGRAAIATEKFRHAIRLYSQGKRLKRSVAPAPLGRNTRSRRHDDKPQDLAVVVQKN
jgi:hypothetical protein